MSNKFVSPDEVGNAFEGFIQLKDRTNWIIASPQFEVASRTEMYQRWLTKKKGYRPVETTARPAVLIQRETTVQVSTPRVYLSATERVLLTPFDPVLFRWFP